jgi:hypothetical protein
MTPDAKLGPVVVTGSVVSVVGGADVGAGTSTVGEGGAVVIASPPDSGPVEHDTDRVASMQIPNPVSFFRNWSRSELSTDEKLRQAVKNAAIKARTGNSCCGNHGEVGC